MTAADDDRQVAALEEARLTVATIVSGRTAHLERLAEGVGRSEARPLELVVVGIGEDPSPLEADGVEVRWARVERRPDGLPLAAARNLALREARGELVLLLDVDCIPSRELCGAVRQALARTDVLAMAPVGYLPDGVARAPGWTEAELWQAATFHPGRGPAPAALEPVEHRLLWSLALAGRRDTMGGRIGGFDEDYVGYGAEDTDFGFRARRAGVPLTWLGPHRAYHQHHSSSSPPTNHLDAIIRNARLFRSKWGVWPMEGWLRAFRERGLVDWDEQGERLEAR